MRRSQLSALIATFAALHALLYFVPLGLWRNWATYITPVEAVILGPQAGFFAALLGSVVARSISPDIFWMFGLVAEPISVLMVGLLAKARWKPVMGGYAVMLLAYFAHPFGRAMPLWTILDVLIALLLIYPTARLSRNLYRSDVRRLSASMVLVSFVCIATDSLVRVFLLVPCGMYTQFFTSFDALYVDFVGAAASSYVEDLIVVCASFLVGVPLLLAASKIGFLRDSNRDKQRRGIQRVEDC